MGLHAFCNNTNEQSLGQVLKKYDQETADFYRWKESVPASLIKENLARQLNCEIGVVLDLIPLQRGASGRITELKIVGSERYLIIGKELLIRKILSESHLKSSAFVVDKKQAEQDIFFDLHGAGWGMA